MANKKDFVVKGGIVVNESTKIGATEDGTIEFKDARTNVKKPIDIAEVVMSDDQGRSKKLAIDVTSGRLKSYDIDGATVTSDKLDFGANNTDDLSEGSSNLYYTTTRVGSYLSANGFDTAANIKADILNSPPAALDTLNELAAALGDDPNFATTVSSSIGTKWTQDNDKISNWDTAYTYSQVGHLPLSGGTITGTITAASTAGPHTFGRISIRDDSIENHQTGGHVVFNYLGTNSGTSEFKNTYIYNGKGGSVATFTGSDASLSVLGNIHVNSDVSGNNYLYLNKATGSDGGLLFRTDGNLKWQNVQGETSINWYSYAATSNVMTLTQEGNLNFAGGQIGKNISDSFTLNGKTQPHYGFNLDPTGSTPIGISGYYGISFAAGGAQVATLDAAGTFTATGGVGGSHIRHGAYKYWKSRDNGGGSTYVIEYDTSAGLSDSNIKWTLTTAGGTQQSGDANVGSLTVNSTTVIDGNRNLVEIGAGAYKANIGSASFSWGGQTTYPTIYGSHADRWVMICFPHVPYLKNGVRGHSGSTQGAKTRYECSDGQSWDVGVLPLDAGGEASGYNFSIGYAGSPPYLGIHRDGQVLLPLNMATGVSEGSFYMSKVRGAIHLNNGAGSGTNNHYQTGITFQGSVGSEAQGGIYFTNNNQVGTRMALATTDSYSAGPKVAVSIDQFGNTNIVRGTLTESSSIRYKENIRNIEGALDKVNGMQGVIYDRKDGGHKNEFGFIAEEVEKIAPELVSYNDDGEVEGVKYAKTVALLLEAVKELTARVEELENGVR